MWFTYVLKMKHIKYCNRITGRGESSFFLFKNDKFMAAFSTEISILFSKSFVLRYFRLGVSSLCR